MVHGRSSLMESLVWLIPFLCVKRREKKKREDEREKKREKMNGKMKEKKKRDEGKMIFFQKMFQDPQTRQMNWLNMFRKNPRRTNFPPFFCKSSESGRF